MLSQVQTGLAVQVVLITHWLIKVGFKRCANRLLNLYMYINFFFFCSEGLAWCCVRPSDQSLVYHRKCSLLLYYIFGMLPSVCFCVCLHLYFCFCKICEACRCSVEPIKRIVVTLGICKNRVKPWAICWAPLKEIASNFPRPVSWHHVRGWHDSQTIINIVIYSCSFS